MNKQKVTKNFLLSLGLVFFIVLILSAVFVIAGIYSISLTSPENNSWTNDDTPPFNFTAYSNISSTMNCSIYVNDTIYGTNSSVVNATSTIINASTIAEGMGYIWKVYCNESGENSTNSTTRTLNIDKTDPTATINAPANNSNLSNATPQINITLTDNLSSAISYTFYINDSADKTGVVANATATNVTMDALADGLYRIKVKATDNASNSKNSSEYWYSIDTGAPTVTVSISSRTTSGASLSATTSESVISCSYSGAGSGSLSGSGTSWSTTLSGLSSRTSYIVTVTCTDALSNSGSGTASFTTSSAGVGGSGSITHTIATLSEGKTISKNLRADDKAKFHIAGIEHIVKIITIYNDSVDIEISSTPIQATLNLDETKKFNLDDDNFYELAITLTKIFGETATLKFEGIKEAVTVTEEEVPEEEKEECLYECCVGEEEYKDKLCAEGFECVDNVCVEEVPEEVAKAVWQKGWFWAVIIIVVMIILFLFSKKKISKKR